MLFGAFLMKNIFIIFPTPILNCIFCIISVKISCFFKQSWQLCTTTSDKTYEKYWIFWWNHAKNIVQNMSWKNDENIFHQKCTKQHCLVTESVSILCLWRDHIDPCEKNQVFSCLSITIGIPIVNACTTSSLYRNACLLWGRGAGSRDSLVSRILRLF